MNDNPEYDSWEIYEEIIHKLKTVRSDLQRKYADEEQGTEVEILLQSCRKKVSEDTVECLYSCFEHYCLCC
jgi:hypothetical protein